MTVAAVHPHPPAPHRQDAVRGPVLAGGMRVAAITLSEPVPVEEHPRLAAVAQRLHARHGLHVTTGPGALEPTRATPAQRAAHLHAALEDPDIDVLWATGGGDDQVLLLPHLNTQVLTAHPKTFIGFSDNTATHLALHATGSRCVYGPNLLSFDRDNTYADQALAALFTADPTPLSSSPTWWSWDGEPRRNDGWRWVQGTQPKTGPLFGGCLELLEMCKGTAYLPTGPAAPSADAMLFVEVAEASTSPQRVLWTMRGWIAAGLLHAAAGLLVGRSSGYSSEQDTELDAVLRQAAAEAGRPDLPIVTGLDFGHTEPRGMLVYGQQCTINPQQRTITLG